MFSPGSSLCCFITGASRGFGCAVAVSIAQESAKSGNSVTFLLAAQSKEGLEKTRKHISENCSSANVYCFAGDLGDLASLPKTLDQMLGSVNQSEFSHALIINNAGNLGDISKHVRELGDPLELQKYYDLNLISPSVITSRFINSFKHSKCYVVQVSSIMAVLPTAGFSLYCTGKAARDMLHQVVAKEEVNVRVLNYAPGPLKTVMIDELLSRTINTEVKEMIGKGTILQPEESTAKLVKLLREDSFTSGAHIDFFDC